MTGASRSLRRKRLVKVSANELQAQLNKAFLGLGLSTAAAADSSDMICWLELHGFDVIPLLPQTLELLTTQDQNDQSDTSPVSYLRWQPEEKTLVCDARGSSTLPYSNLWLEYARSLSAQHGAIKVDVRKAPDAFLAVGYLAKFVSAGINICGYAQRSNESTAMVFKFDASKAVTEAWSVARPPSESTLQLVLSPVGQGSFEKVFEAFDVQTAAAIYHKTSEDLLKSHDEYLSSGIEISRELWEALKHHGTATLVEADEQSRSGAGPSD